MQLRYGVATSLDGFIAPPDESTDWIVEDPSIDLEALYASFDFYVMGRKTYEIISAASDTNPLKGRPRGSVVVVSRTLKAEDHPGITILDTGHLEYISQLKKIDGRGIWLMSGGVLAAECLEAGLLDAVDASVIPVLLGSGFKLITTSTCQSQTAYALALRSLEMLDKSGILMTKYDVVYGNSAQGTPP